MTITLLETLQITIMSMGIVFLVLVLLMCVVYLFKYIPNIEHIDTKFRKRPKPTFTPFEEMDEDMQVAVLVATVDYQKKTKKDVKLKSIRKI